MLACLPNPLETADLVAFAEEILNGKLHFLCSDPSHADIETPDLRC